MRKGEGFARRAQRVACKAERWCAGLSGHGGRKGARGKGKGHGQREAEGSKIDPTSRFERVNERVTH